MRTRSSAFRSFHFHFFLLTPSPKKGPKRIREQILILTGRGLEVEAHGRIGKVALF